MTSAAQHQDLEDDPTVRPNVRRYVDYRAYLRDMTAHLKATEPGFSYRVFARRAGFSSPNYLKLVSEGDRNLSVGSADKFARGLGLGADEGRVLKTLVELGAARNDHERNASYAKLRRLAASDEVARLRDEQFAIY